MFGDKSILSGPKTLLFLGAHPDDETFGMGSTLAHYASAGVKVYCVCATQGEAGTVAPEHMKGYATIGDMRWAELKCAAEVLGLTDVIYLGYRDSGMPSSEDNKHPNALVMAPVDEVAGRIVKISRDIKPDVVITGDAGGGYGHPDHIAIHNATVEAFYVASDPAKYPEAGPVFQPHKLYFGVRPHTIMKVIVRLMPFFGQDPHRFGRNKDIDLTHVIKVKYPLHAVIRPTKQAIELQNKAAACHSSQGGGQPRPVPFRIVRIVEKLRGQPDYFMRAYPPPTHGHREKDLFEGVG